jgi:hypothetical protein
MVLNVFACRWVRVAFIFLIMVIAGCTTTPAVKIPEPIAPPPEIASAEGWWFARFQMQWPNDKPVNWHWDLLIAHKIVAPVLDQSKGSIRLWRFHRRAARDQAGHQFSFIFYASAETAYQIFDALRSNGLLAEMKSAGVIIADIYDQPDKIEKPQIGDTSDPNWPSAIQKSWPYYIMGASQMWLELISETLAELPSPNAALSLAENEQLYKEVNEIITSLWEVNGRHAFLHHLNALFGYNPVIVYEKRMLNF